MGALLNILGQEAIKSVVGDASKDAGGAGMGAGNPLQQLLPMFSQSQNEGQPSQSPQLPDYRKAWNFNPVMSFGGSSG